MLKTFFVVWNLVLKHNATFSFDAPVERSDFSALVARFIYLGIHRLTDEHFEHQLLLNTN